MKVFRRHSWLLCLRRSWRPAGMLQRYLTARSWTTPSSWHARWSTMDRPCPPWSVNSHHGPTTVSGCRRVLGVAVQWVASPEWRPWKRLRLLWIHHVWQLLAWDRCLFSGQSLGHRTALWFATSCIDERATTPPRKVLQPSWYFSPHRQHCNQSARCGLFLCTSRRSVVCVCVCVCLCVLVCWSYRWFLHSGWTDRDAVWGGGQTGMGRRKEPLYMYMYILWFIPLIVVPNV